MDHLPSPFSPFYTNPRTVILSERANARDAKDLLMRRLELSARGNDPPTRHVSTKDARHSEVRKWRAFSHAPTRNRTENLRIKSPLLCQLSYRRGGVNIIRHKVLRKRDPFRT